MQNSHRHAVATLAFALLLAEGCATTNFPRNLPTGAEAAESTSGSWVVVTTYAGIAEGELVAVGHDSLFLFAEDTLLGIPLGEIQRANVYVTDYPMDPDLAGMWVFLGGLSTASHGAYLLVSLPIWLIAGGISASAVAEEADAGDLNFPAYSWNEVMAYARFPQGMDGVKDRLQLKPAGMRVQPNASRPKGTDENQ